MNEEVKMLVLPRQSYSDGFEHFHVEVFRILVGHFSKQTKFEINDRHIIVRLLLLSCSVAVV